MELFAQILMWGLMVFYFVAHVFILRKAEELPDPPDYPPKDWDSIQKWIEGPMCFPAIGAYLIIGSVIAWFAVK